MERNIKDGEIVICNILKTPTIVKIFRLKTREESKCYVTNSSFETICVDKKYIHKADILEVNAKALDVKKDRIKFALTTGFRRLTERKSKYKVIKVQISPISDVYMLCKDIKIGESKKLAPMSATIYPSGNFIDFKDEVSKSWAALHNKSYSVQSCKIYK